MNEEEDVEDAVAEDKEKEEEEKEEMLSESERPPSLEEIFADDDRGDRSLST